jgi:predicted ABC-type transport system involved in lysophospholipase L1 biosynthesis ATPase subunit
MARLEATGVRIARAGQVLIDAVDLVVEPGQSVAVTGPSGSGKTSLLGVLAGVFPPEAGRVTLDGQPVEPHRVGIVLQGYGLVSLLTAAENIEVALRALGAAPTEASVAAAGSLAAVGLGELSGHLVEELSGGQQQRVSVARALAAKPALLIADEPTAEQDAATRDLVLGCLFAVVDRGGSLIFATHDPDVAARCDRQLPIG